MNVRFVTSWLVILAGIVPLWSSDSHAIYGTWKQDVTKGVGSPSKLAFHITGDEVTVKVDVSTPRQYRLGAPSENGGTRMRRIDPRTLEAITRVSTIRYTVSEDGRQLTRTIDGKSSDGTPLPSSDVYRRLTGSPLGGHEGTWESDGTGARSTPLIAKFRSTGDGIQFECGPIAYTAKFDGSEAPFKSGASGTVAVQRPNQKTILVTRKHPAGGFQIKEKWQVSADGRILTVESVWEGQGDTATATTVFERQE